MHFTVQTVQALFSPIYTPTHANTDCRDSWTKDSGGQAPISRLVRTTGEGWLWDATSMPSPHKNCSGSCQPSMLLWMPTAPQLSTASSSVDTLDTALYFADRFPVEMRNVLKQSNCFLTPYVPSLSPLMARKNPALHILKPTDLCHLTGGSTYKLLLRRPLSFPVMSVVQSSSKLQTFSIR